MGRGELGYGVCFLWFGFGFGLCELLCFVSVSSGTVTYSGMSGMVQVMFLMLFGMEACVYD